MIAKYHGNFEYNAKRFTYDIDQLLETAGATAYSCPSPNKAKAMVYKGCVLQYRMTYIRQ